MRTDITIRSEINVMPENCRGSFSGIHLVSMYVFGALLDAKIRDKLV